MSIAFHHAEWLSLLEVSGPFLSMPVLERAFPQGLEAYDAGHHAQLRAAYEEWRESQVGKRPDWALHEAWVRYVLQESLEMDEQVLLAGEDIGPEVQARVEERADVIRPDFMMVDPDNRQPTLLIQLYKPTQGLNERLKGNRKGTRAANSMKDSPTTRMMTLLHACGVGLGLVTNGEHWVLVNAARGETTGFVSWYASLWVEERLTWRAFRSLLGVPRFFGVPKDQTLLGLLDESRKDQHDVTDQLGYQVRQAVEILVQAIDKADQDSGRLLLAQVPESRLYEASLTFMMRLVFLLTAEERGLLVLDNDFYNQHYAVVTLRAQLREQADKFGELVLERRYDAWSRLLATFRAVFGGVSHQELELPAYGGSLFDPNRFPFLEGRRPSPSEADIAHPLPINNRTVLYLLEALQRLQLKSSARGPVTAQMLSFRALDVEQIGHVYEGLLDHVASRATEAMLGLVGAKNKEPELALATLEELLQEKGEKGLLKFLKNETGRTTKALKKALKQETEGTRAQRLRAACGNEEGLYRRVLPFAGLVRDDAFGYPVVIPTGAVYVTTGATRRQTGSHYTPRSLTEPIVQHTLEPLVYYGPTEGKPRADWVLRPPEKLLNLKICDMAMGSGAFLVQTCRYLSERLVEAWEAAPTPRTAPTPSPSPNFGGGEQDAPKVGGGNASPLSIFDDDTIFDDDVLGGTEGGLAARRLVVSRCLYGVDKNPLAVEMAKLSLWLITLDKERPFTFLDHALKCGDSLVGVNFDQLMVWNLDLKAKREFATDGIYREIEKVVQLRHEIATTPVMTPQDQQRKRFLLAEAEALTNDLRTGGDLLIGSYYNDLSAKEQGTLRTSLLAAYRKGQDVPPQHARHADLGDLRPFHWQLEFPEVFILQEKSSRKGASSRVRVPPKQKPVLSLPKERKGGFDAFVGNPPFIGGTRIRGALGGDYLRYLKTRWNHTPGSADMSAYFFLRSFEQLRFGGTLGLIATNTIAQGDTREVGLDYIHQQEGKIYRATNNQPWPGLAAVVVNIVHLYKGDYRGQWTLDNLPAKRQITPMLDDLPLLGPPNKLAANANRSIFGTYVLGLGFIMLPEEAQALIAKDARNAEVLFPYLNGKDLNSNPDQSPSRWIINFFDWPLQRGAKGSWLAADAKQQKQWRRSGIVPNDYVDPVAADYPDCLAIVKEKVYPERQKNREKKLREIWWRFKRPTMELYETIAPLRRVLVVVQTSKYLSIGFQGKKIVYSHMTIVIATEQKSDFSILNSSIHECWVRQYSSTLETRLRYIPSDCFETFPFPHPTPQQKNKFEQIGETYHQYRQQVMLERQEGLTKTYNRFHNPDESASDMVRLRELHVQMDEAVAAAYGWHDLELGHGFHKTAQGVRFTISDVARRDVLGRLLELNHERYAEEVKAGLHEKKGKGKGSGKKKGSEKKGKKKGKRGKGGQMNLF